MPTQNAAKIVENFVVKMPRLGTNSAVRNYGGLKYFGASENARLRMPCPSVITLHIKASQFGCATLDTSGSIFSSMVAKEHQIIPCASLSFTCANIIMKCFQPRGIDYYGIKRQSFASGYMLV